MSPNDPAARTGNRSSAQKSYGKRTTLQHRYQGQDREETQDAAGGVGKPDIEFSANVKARELRFEEKPETEVRFWGYPERNSVSANERKNLPEEVQQDVTYRNVDVRLHIASALVTTEEPDATKAAKQMAKELEVDLYKVRGSGADGRITYEDVRRAAQG